MAEKLRPKKEKWIKDFYPGRKKEASVFRSCFKKFGGRGRDRTGVKKSELTLLDLRSSLNYYSVLNQRHSYHRFQPLTVKQTK
jgi:hypothetical protein